MSLALSGSAATEQQRDDGENPELRWLDRAHRPKGIRHAHIEPQNDELDHRQEDDEGREKASAPRDTGSDVDVAPTAKDYWQEYERRTN